MRDAEGPGINPKFPGKGVDEPGVHAAGAGGNTAGEGGNAVGKGSELGGALGAGTGIRCGGQSIRFSVGTRSPAPSVRICIEVLALSFWNTDAQHG